MSSEQGTVTRDQIDGHIHYVAKFQDKTAVFETRTAAECWLEVVRDDTRGTLEVDRGTTIASLIEGIDKLYSLEGSQIAYSEVLNQLRELNDFVWDMVVFVEDSQ